MTGVLLHQKKTGAVKGLHEIHAYGRRRKSHPKPTGLMWALFKYLREYYMSETHVDHYFAKEYAELHKDDSNLARCYLDLVSENKELLISLRSALKIINEIEDAAGVKR